MAPGYKTIRDPVHGDIRVHAEDVALLDAPELQRLRGVRQLGTAYHVFPGAQHTRFEHMLGTYHVAGKLMDRIRENHERDSLTCLHLSERDREVVRAVALLHDITHIPHGHAIEDQDGLFPPHDQGDLLARALSSGRVGEVLTSRGMLESVTRHILDNPKTETPYLGQLVSGYVGADMLDYLRRDAYFTGLRIDYDDRLFDSIKIDPGSKHVYVDLVKHNMDREDVLTEVLNLLHSRYVSSERIYYHHAKVASGALISRAVELSISEGLTRDEVARTRDDEMLVMLRNRAKNPAIGSLLDRYESRNLLKRCFVGTRRGNEGCQDHIVRTVVDNQSDRRRIEQEIARALDLEDASQVIVYCPKKEMQLKAASVLVRRAGKGIRPLSEYTHEFPVLDQLVTAYRDLWKLFVFVPLGREHELAQAGSRVEEILNRWFPGITNQYRI